MFSIGDYIVYGSNGVFRVNDLGTIEMSGIPSDKLYYTLISVDGKDSKIFTPVDNKKVNMRPISSKEDVLNLIDNFDSIEMLSNPNDIKTEDLYRETIKKGECKDWIKVIKTLYVKKRARKAEGKKMSASDERFLNKAEECLYQEFSIPLHINKDKVEDFILNRVNIN